MSCLPFVFLAFASVSGLALAQTPRWAPGSAAIRGDATAITEWDLDGPGPSKSYVVIGGDLQVKDASGTGFIPASVVLWRPTGSPFDCDGEVIIIGRLTPTPGSLEPARVNGLGVVDNRLFVAGLFSGWEGAANVGIRHRSVSQVNSQLQISPLLGSQGPDTNGMTQGIDAVPPFAGDIEVRDIAVDAFRGKVYFVGDFSVAGGVPWTQRVAGWDVQTGGFFALAKGLGNVSQVSGLQTEGAGVAGSFVPEVGVTVDPLTGDVITSAGSDDVTARQSSFVPAVVDGGASGFLPLFTAPGDVPEGRRLVRWSAASNSWSYEGAPIRWSSVPNVRPSFSPLTWAIGRTTFANGAGSFTFGTSGDATSFLGNVVGNRPSGWSPLGRGIAAPGVSSLPSTEDARIDDIIPYGDTVVASGTLVRYRADTPAEAGPWSTPPFTSGPLADAELNLVAVWDGAFWQPVAQDPPALAFGSTSNGIQTTSWRATLAITAGTVTLPDDGSTFGSAFQVLGPITLCPADIAGEGASEGSDGVLDNNDFALFINWFFEGDLRADFGSSGGALGGDGVLDNNDFIAFLLYFFDCCSIRR